MSFCYSKKGTLLFYFKTLEYNPDKLNTPPPVKGIDVNADNNWVNNDLTKPAIP